MTAISLGECGIDEFNTTKLLLFISKNIYFKYSGIYIMLNYKSRLFAFENVGKQ
jgi:hypothetical protein